MADYPYRVTLAMPTASPVAGADNVSLAAWLNAAQPQTVQDDLGPPLSATGMGLPTHHWASSASTATGTQELVDHLAGLAGMALPGETGWWGNATLAEKLDFTRDDLHPTLFAATGGGVLLEDAAALTFPEGLLTTMSLQTMPYLLPAHPSTNLAWRVRSDLGALVAGSGLPVAVDGNAVGYWEDLGPARTFVTNGDPDLWPAWYSDRINTHPSVSVTYPGVPCSMVSPAAAPLAHGIGTGPFSFYAVFHLNSVVSEDRQTIWSSSLTGQRHVEIAAEPGFVDPDLNVGYVHFDISYLVGATPHGVGLTFYAQYLLPGTWYYLLVTRRPGDSMLRVWVNGLYLPEALEDEADQFIPYEIPDGAQSLFDTQEVVYRRPLDGEIAEVGLYTECLETSGAKAQLDAYIMDRYGLGVAL